MTLEKRHFDLTNNRVIYLDTFKPCLKTKDDLSKLTILRQPPKRPEKNIPEVIKLY